MLGSVAVPLPTDVVCAAFGSRRSQDIVACGGADGAVHVLPFAGSNRLAKLEGHPTSVTAVTFDSDQTRVVAGSAGGSIRLWDLSTEQCIRTFSGHRTTVTAVDYHNFGEFIATVSDDTHLRIWDVRKKACLQSYKGVPNGLTAVRFNPNGKWVASGCSQGVVRIYDLTNGQCIRELVSHQAGLTSLRFHPEHLFLTAGSKDGTMSLWELDTFQQSFRSEPIVQRGGADDAGGVQQVHFAVQGEHQTEVLVASEGLLRSFPFQRMSNRTAAHFEAPWKVCRDLAVGAGGTEVLSVECCGASVHFSRLALRPPGGAKKHGESAPSGSRSAPPPPPPAAAAGPAFRMNENAAAALVQRAVTPPSERRSSIPMMPAPSGDRQQAAAPAKHSAVANLVSSNPSNTGSSAAAAPTASSDDSATLVVVQDLLKNSAATSSLLQRRMTHLRTVRASWHTDPRSALRHLNSIAASETDCLVIADFLVAMQNQRMKEKISMELLPDVMILLSTVIRHNKDPLLMATLRIARSMNTKFRAKIDETLRGATFALNGVDLAMEARIEKSKELQAHFETILAAASALSIRSDPLGDEARLVVQEVPSWKARGR